MKRVAVVLLLALFASQAPGQTLKLPAEVKGLAGDFIQVPASTDGNEVRWVPLDAGLRLFPVNLLKDTKTAVVTGRDGSYRLLAYTAKGDVPSEPAVCVVVIGGVTPPPPPPPTPGTRTVLLVRETASATPELARAIIALRAGAHAEYLKSKGHVLTILDDDVVGPDGQPSVAVKWWWAHYKDVKLPALVIGTADRAVLSVTPLSDKATADEVIALIKKAGG